MNHSLPIATLIWTILVRVMPQMAAVKLNLGFLFFFFLANIFVLIIISLLSSCFWTKQALFILTVLSVYGQTLCSTSQVPASTPVDAFGGATRFPLYCLFVFEQRTSLVCSIPTFCVGTKTATVGRTKILWKSRCEHLETIGLDLVIQFEWKKLINTSTLIAVEVLLYLYTRTLGEL